MIESVFLKQSDLVLRPLLERELGSLAHVIQEVSQAQLANRWREQGSGYRELLAAELDGELVGTVSVRTVSVRKVTRDQPALHLFALEVANARRGQGIGAAIVQQVVEDAALRGCRSVYLEVETDNPARRLYHRLGLRRVGEAFVNSWWKFNDDGSRQQQNETSYRMVRRLPAGRRSSSGRAPAALSV